MNKIILIFILLTCSFLFSCQAVKDGLSGRKSENSDEFLVKKKKSFSASTRLYGVT